MTDRPASYFHARSLLFVPGDRPERIAKALASGVDAICIDLEDAVAPTRKDQAREEAARFLQSRPVHPQITVRINGLRTAEGLRDILHFRHVPAPDAIIIPKTESAEEINLAAEVYGTDRQHWIPLIESARGLEQVADIASRSTDLVALMFGGADFSADIGATFEWEPLLYARQRILTAAGMRRIPAIDVPFLVIDDEQGLMDETRRIVALGFSCKSAIHPRQVASIHTALMPSQVQIDRAQHLLKASRTVDGGVLAVDGLMVDGPVLVAARQTLHRAGLTASA